MAKRTMSLKDAADLVPDDLPDGAFWAMAHELAGAEYGEAWDELETGKITPPRKEKPYKCKRGCGKRFVTEQGRRDHHRDRHGVTE